MMQVDYAGGTMLTGDAIADVVLRYAAALGGLGRSTTIEVPGITADGLPGTFLVLLGPASQILAEPTERDGEIEDAAFVAAIEREIDVLEHPPRAMPFEGALPADDDIFD